MSIQNDEIFFIDLGSPSIETQGHEQAKPRPCIVLKDFPLLKLAIVIPLTSVRKNDYYFSIVKIEKGIGNLKQDSFALCHQLRSISHQRFLKNLERWICTIA